MHVNMCIAPFIKYKQSITLKTLHLRDYSPCVLAETSINFPKLEADNMKSKISLQKYLLTHETKSCFFEKIDPATKPASSVMVQILIRILCLVLSVSLNNQIEKEKRRGWPCGIVIKFGMLCFSSLGAPIWIPGADLQHSSAML